MKKKLKDLLDYEQPTKYIVETENYSDEYKLPVLTAGKSFVLGYTNETEGIFKGKNEPVIIFDDFTRDTKYVDFDFKVKSSAMKILHKHNKDDSLKYLHYALNNINYVPFSHKRLWISDFSNMEIDYPSPEIQNTIAMELDTIQSAIDNKKQQLSLLDEAVKSEFIEMFGEIKETVIIKDVCDVSGGYSFKSNDISDNEGVKILQIGNVAINDISWETTNYLPNSFIEKYNNFSLNENDIVMALTRPIIQSLGNVKTCMIRACDLPCLLNQRVGRIRPKDNTNIHYIFYCFMQHSFTSYIQACCKGSSQPNMSTKDIENFIIPKVPIELQNQFAAFVQQIDKSKFVVKQQIADLQELLDSKMQEYFGVE